jgi:fatty acid-binding protein DegV
MDEVVKQLAFLIGGGGLTAIILGLLGFLKGKPFNAGDQPGRGVMLAALYADQNTVQRMADGVDRMIHATDRLTECVKDHTDALRDQTREDRRR